MREVKVFPLKDKKNNRPNYIKSIWKPSFSKIYIVLNNRHFPSRTYTVLVSIGDLVKLVFALKSFLKSSERNSISHRVGLGGII